MSFQVSGLNTVQNNSKSQMNTMSAANSVATSSNTLEGTPATDTFVKPTQNKTKKTMLILGGLALAGIGLFFAVKKGQTSRVEKVFAELKNEPSKAQKTFQEVFLREDITEKEALEMVKRYESIWKIKDKKEYIEALFKEVKKNCRLDNTKIKLAFDLPCDGCTNAGGFYSPADEVISITTRCSKEAIMQIMHHEFRHALQHRASKYSEQYIKFHALIDLYLTNFSKKNPNYRFFDNPEEDAKLLKQFVEKAKKELKEKGYPDTKKMKELYTSMKKDLLENADVFKFPDKYSDWAQKCAESHFLSNYIKADESFKKYYEQFSEQDARFAEESIAKLFGLRSIS